MVNGEDAVASCECCAGAEQHPQMYQVGCIGCLARLLDATPDPIRAEALAKFVEILSEVDWRALRAAMQTQH